MQETAILEPFTSIDEFKGLPQMYINTETLLLVCYPNIICPALAAMVAGLPIYLEFKPISVHKILPNFQPNINNPTLHRNM